LLDVLRHRGAVGFRGGKALQGHFRQWRGRSHDLTQNQGEQAREDDETLVHDAMILRVT
jgi:hypothetical protein